MRTVRLRDGWTREAIEERVRRFVPRDGCRNEHGACFYRLVRNGVEYRCAIGAVLPDELADLVELVEGTIEDLLARGEQLDLRDLPFLSAEDAQAFQHAHDCGPRGETRERVLAWVNDNVLNPGEDAA